MDNPYQSILDALERRQGGGSPVWRLGTVLRAPPMPLAVDFGGTAQEGGNLLLGSSLGELEAGDRVVALSDNDQRFILLCKVVGA